MNELVNFIEEMEHNYGHESAGRWATWTNNMTQDELKFINDALVILCLADEFALNVQIDYIKMLARKTKMVLGMDDYD